MNYKKLLTASLIFANILCVSDVFAQELQAKVAIGSTLSKKHAEIDKMIEYNNYSEADAALREILNASPNDLDAKALRIIWMAKQHKLAPAQEELDKLLKQHPNNASLHYAQGLVYLKRRTSSDVTYIRDSKNLLDEAIKEFVKAVNLNSNYYQAYNAMGVATLQLGNNADAKELFETALKINPQFATAYDNLGNIALINGDLAAAEDNFMKSLKYNSHNPTTMYHLGQVAVRQKDYNKALTWLNHSLHINPNSAPALTLQGECYLVQGNQAAAINSFKKAVTVKPENSRAYINLANVYQKRSDAEFAMEQLKTVLAINPRYNDAIMRVADLSLETRKYHQALDYYSKLVDDSVYGNDAIIGLANTYYEMSKDRGDSGDMTTNKEVYLAYDYINKAIERVPDRLDLHLAKIKLARLTHQLPLSKDSLNYIVQAASNNLMDNVIKGEAYLALGREKDAVYTFENAINFANNVDDELYLAEILVHNKQFRTAKVALKKVLMQEPDNIIAKNGLAYIDLCEIKSNEFFDVAQRQFKEENYASAIEYCNRAIDFYHNSPAIAKLKAMSYEEEKNYQGAIKYYNQYLSMNPSAPDREAIVKKLEKFKNKI
ncbi:MAG: tetratricopeptide repeat protein [Brachyspira sp.]|uniref:tetratricopeptide repeat protein n=1 Tax=Candidatus Scatousia sp. TaxID=3085663 RepID=UPI00402869F0|nr:tetratricopeptide repeat protein [Brachyspira sp.]